MQRNGAVGRGFVPSVEPDAVGVVRFCVPIPLSHVLTCSHSLWEMHIPAFNERVAGTKSREWKPLGIQVGC